MLLKEQCADIVIQVGENVEVAISKLNKIGLDSNFIEIREQDSKVSEIILKPMLYSKYGVHLVIDTDLISYSATKDSVKYWMTETYGLYTAICKVAKEKGFTDRECWGTAYGYISELTLRVNIDNNDCIHIK